ncbi:response regulator transcription factor [Micromonospora sp. DT201]|uniref:response regulator transcription factor n=1 Tax=Micromonospora sp. DT201 TaxID=3393442 RepID=UPI003CEF5321
MNAHPRPSGKSKAVPVGVVVISVLVMAMCTVGAQGPLAVILPPSILTRLVAHYVTAPRPDRPTPTLRRLTSREVEVLTLIGGGLSNDELATALVISVKTVKTHITHLMAKLAVRDRAQLVIAAFDAGLVRPRH